MKVRLSDSTFRRARSQNPGEHDPIGFRFTLVDNPTCSLELRGYTRRKAVVKAAELLDGAGKYYIQPIV